MTISYPLQLPTASGVKRVTLHQAVSVAVSQNPWTYQSHVQKFPGQLWGADITLPSMTRADAEEWISWFLSLNGQEGTFLLGDPSAQNPRGTGLGAPVVDGAGQTGSVLLTKGWTPSCTGVLLAGDYLSINNRLYKNLKTVSSDGSGDASLDIWPALRTSPIDGATVTIRDPLGTFRLNANANSIFGAAEDLMYDFSFSCIEAL